MSKTDFPSIENISFSVIDGIGNSEKQITILDLTEGQTPTEEPSYWELQINRKPETSITTIVSVFKGEPISLQKYPLTDIDDTREEILTLGETEAQITPTGSSKTGNLTKPYLKNLIGFRGARLLTSTKQYGLALKTYQSDIFNN